MLAANAFLPTTALLCVLCGCLLNHPIESDVVTGGEMLLAEAAWQDQRFGDSVALLDGWAIIGAPGGAAYQRQHSGTAYIFERGPSGWRQAARLGEFGRAPGDGFGQVAAGATTIAVGADGDDDAGDNAGAAYVYELSDGAWRPVDKLYATDPGSRDGFGCVVAVSPAGNRIFVGNRKHAAFMFVRRDGRWRHERDFDDSLDLGLETFRFNLAVNGDTAIIGDPRTGGARAFVLEQGRWRNRAALLRQNVSEMGDAIVAIAGDTVFVGGGGESVSVFQRAEAEFREIDPLRPRLSSSVTGFGQTLAANEDAVLVGSRTTAAFLFERSNGNWRETRKIFPRPHSAEKTLGGQVAMHNDTTLIGSPWRTVNGVAAGAAFIVRTDDELAGETRE